MSKKIIMALATSIAPWLAKDSKEGKGIVVSTRLSYDRKCAASDTDNDGREKESKNVINGLSKCKNWDDSTLFRTVEQPSLTAVIREKFLVSGDVMKQQGGISAIYKDNLNDLCLVNSKSKLNVHHWVYGKANAVDLDNFRQEITSLEDSISAGSTEPGIEIKDLQPTFRHEIFLHLPGTRIMNHCKYFPALGKELDLNIEPMFGGGFYRLTSNNRDNGYERDFETLNMAVNILRDTEENARNTIRKRGVNLFFKAMKNALGNLNENPLCSTWHGCTTLLSNCWLAYDFGMLEHSSPDKIKQAISNIGDVTAETLVGSSSEDKIMKCRIKEIRKALK